MTNKTVIVVGSTGKVGSILTKLLVDRQYQVKATYRSETLELPVWSHTRPNEFGQSEAGVSVSGAPKLSRTSFSMGGQLARRWDDRDGAIKVAN